jgi:hypothetical protein
MSRGYALVGDYIYRTGADHQPLTALGSIRAYELADSPTGGNTVTFNLYGTLGSLDPVRFGDVAGGEFADSSTTNALGGPTNSVPEPGSLVTLSAGLLVAIAFAKRWRS